MYKRNRVRLELLPLLEELAGGRAALVARAEAAERQSAGLRLWLEQAADEYGGRFWRHE